MRATKTSVELPISLPEDLPNFPFKSVEQFQTFDLRLQIDGYLHQYMVSYVCELKEINFCLGFNRWGG